MQLTELLRPTHPIHLLLGLTVWLGWFGALYGGVTLGCQVAPPDVPRAWSWINISAGILSIGVVALMVWGAAYCWRGHRALRGTTQPKRFIAAVSAGLYLLSATATVAVSAMLTLLPPCLQ